MKLVQNWKEVAKRAHSMWATYLGMLGLTMPDLLYYAADLETSPRLWWFLGMGFLVYGIIGRLKDQGIDATTTKSPLPVVLLAALIAIGGTWMTGERPHDPAPAPPAVAGVPLDERAFLQAAVPLVSKWEGLELAAYRDPVGIWTICYGETKGVAPGMVKTEAECSAMLGRRLLEFRSGLHGYLTADTKSRRLPYTRDAAYGSFAYNVGVAGAGKSTAVKRLNAGDIAGGCEALTWWNKAGGRVLRGLVARRAEERDMCLLGA
ncbi:MAG: lysozyme [Rhodobacteraceae bacterium]|nr:lysozyme [Paracoccaceae bacterium]